MDLFLKVISLKVASTINRVVLEPVGSQHKPGMTQGFSTEPSVRREKFANPVEMEGLVMVQCLASGSCVTLEGTMTSFKYNAAFDKLLSERRPRQKSLLRLVAVMKGLLHDHNGKLTQVSGE